MKPGHKCLIISDFLCIDMKKYLSMNVSEMVLIDYEQCYEPQIGF